MPVDWYAYWRPAWRRQDVEPVWQPQDYRRSTKPGKQRKRKG